MGKLSRSLRIEKSGRSQNQCANNCSCSKYLCSLVWRILHMQSLYPYNIQQVQALTPPDHLTRFFAKWVVNTQFVANILCTDKAEFIRDSIVNFHNTHAWIDDNPNITVSLRHQHWFSINVCVGILGDQHLGPVVLHNRLTGAVHHHLWWMIYQYSWNMCLFINDNICGLYMTVHHLIFSALSDSTWPRLLVNRGQDVAAQSCGLHDPLTLTHCGPAAKILAFGF
jgi:hypothetical protein